MNCLTVYQWKYKQIYYEKLHWILTYVDTWFSTKLTWSLALDVVNHVVIMSDISPAGERFHLKQRGREKSVTKDIKTMLRRKHVKSTLNILLLPNLKLERVVLKHSVSVK